MYWQVGRHLVVILLICNASVCQAQFRGFRGRELPSATADITPAGRFGRPGQSQGQGDEQPFAFQKPLPPAPKVPGIQLPPGTKLATDTNELVNQAIELNSRRRVDVATVPPWAMTHAILALRQELTVSENGREMKALDWISNQARFWRAAEAKNQGAYWFEATQYGARAQPFDGTPYEFEGHTNQTLALIAMSNLPLDHQFKVAGGRTVTMADMVRHAQMNADSSGEITWTLWFLTQYLDPDTQWTNIKGEQWSMEYLVRQQTQAEVTSAPCGGTHGLFALAYIRNSYLRKHNELHGIWLSADMKLQQYIEAAKSLQNADGSFSTMYFKGTGFSQDYDERLKTSGHMLEWLMMALPQKRLEEEWVQRGIRSLARDLCMSSTQPGNCGFVYHSVHALNLYRQRMGNKASKPTQSPADLVQNDTATKTTPQVTEKPTVTADNSGTPRPLPIINSPNVAIRPIPAQPTSQEPPIERPVPDMPQPKTESPPAIASAKPEVDAQPTAPESGMPPLVKTPPMPTPSVVDATPALPTPNVEPPRLAAIPADEPRMLKPIPEVKLTPAPVPLDPPQTEDPGKAVRINPGAQRAMAPQARPQQEMQRRPARLFIPFRRDRLQLQSGEETEENAAQPAIEENVIPMETLEVEAVSSQPVEPDEVPAEIVPTPLQGPALPAPRN